MKSVLCLALLLVGTISLRAGIHVDVSVLSKEDVEKKAIPVIAEVARKDGDGLVVKLTLKEPFGVIGEFSGYELRVSKAPLVSSDVKRQFLNLRSFERRESARAKVAEFELTEAEVPRSYIVISSWAGRESDGKGVMKSLCLLVKDLLRP